MWDDCFRIPVILGGDGFYGLRNADRVRLGGLKVLRNATLEDHTLRTTGGATSLGVTLGATVKGLRAIDYWPDDVTQRTVVVGDDGKIWKDNGSGASWSTLLTGLTVSGAIPAFTRGGSEVLGRSRQLFYADAKNQERVLVGDAASMSALSGPVAEWTGTYRPRQFVIHQGYNWGFGNMNTPHLVFRSLDTNHQDFTTTRFAIPIYSGEGEYLAAGASFKGNLILWKYPDGVYVYDTSDADTTKWFTRKIGTGGIAGPNCFCALENDILWVDPFGGWHLISAAQEFGNVRSEDISARKLGRYLPNTINKDQLPFGDLIYYSDKQQVRFACSALGRVPKELQIVMDVADAAGAGERWDVDDRDRNEALFLRKKSGILIPAMIDEAGLLWELDRPDRNKDGAGYTFEWWTHDTDFRQVVPSLTGKIINACFLQVLYDPRTATGVHTFETWGDGTKRTTLNPTLSGSGAVLPVTLPFVLGADSIRVTLPQRLRGQANRWSFRGYGTQAGVDTSIAGLIFGCHAGE